MTDTLPIIIPGKPVHSFEISRMEHRLHIKLPIALKKLYLTYGAARIVFSDDDKTTINRVLAPFEIMDVLKHQGKHRHVHHFEHYAHMQKNRIPFFETKPNEFLTIGYLFDNSGKIYDLNELAANSLAEFTGQGQKAAI